MTRRAFVRRAATAAGAAMLTGLGPLAQAAAAPRTPRKLKTRADLAVTTGDDPARNVRAAVKTLGGMGKFVKQGATVVIKPNMAWDRPPELAGNTNPAVVAELVTLCLAAGAKRVNVFDRPCDSAKRVYDVSGIRAAAEQAGAKVYFVDDWNAVAPVMAAGSPMTDWPLFRDAVECDTFINVPVLKHHGLTKLTLSMKNLMGICLSDRGKIHEGIGRRLADLAAFIRPELTIIDATRVLTDHGPSGGDPQDVAERKTVIAGTDFVLVDAFAADFAGRAPRDIPYIDEAAALGYGRLDFKAARIRRLKA